MVIIAITVDIAFAIMAGPEPIVKRLHNNNNVSINKQYIYFPSNQ